MRKRNSVLATAAAVSLLFGGTTAAAEESPSPTPATDSAATQLERISAYTQPSVVYIEMKWTAKVWDRFNKLYLNNGSPFELTTRCTGYVVNSDGYIATAGHCVDSDEIAPAFYQTAAQWAIDNGYYENAFLSLEDVLGFDHYVTESPNDNRKKKPQLDVTTAWSVSAGGVETGKALPARVIKSQDFDEGDGAVLKVEETNLNALPLAEEDVEIGSDIVSIGYPGSVDQVVDADFTPSFKDGSISSKKTVSGGLLSVYEVNADVSPGMSGGPTVNMEGEVVGFNSFGISKQLETQAFNFIRPVGMIRELIGDAGTTNELSEDSQNYLDGLDAFFAGDKLTAVEKLESVVDSQPTHELAKDFLDKAEALPDPPAEEETGGGLGLVLGIVAGVLVLGAIAAGVVFALARKKKGGSPAAPATAGYAGPPAAAGPPGGFQGPSAPQASPSASSADTAVLDRAQNAAPPAAGPAPAAASAPVTSAAPVAESTVFCSNCGTKGERGQKFCKNCGTQL